MLTHINDKGVDMVDISNKARTARTAVASGEIHLKKQTIDLVANDGLRKGNLLATAQLAGIMAAKRTSDLIPLCHQIPLDKISVEFDVRPDRIVATCTVKTTYGTGVEMEALQGASQALLTIWDMVKANEKDEGGQYRTTLIDNLRVLKKEK